MAEDDESKPKLGWKTWTRNLIALVWDGPDTLENIQRRIRKHEDQLVDLKLQAAKNATAIEYMTHFFSTSKNNPTGSNTSN